MTRILIAGAGPAGAALAFLLARRGIRVTLLERHTDFAREFRGEILLPGGVAALDQMGLAEDLQAIPVVKPERLEFFTWGRKRFSNTFTPETFGRYRPILVSQPALLEMLVEKASAFSNFEFHRGATVRDLLRGEDGRVVGVLMADKSGEGEIHADLVVGADGRNSVVRQRSGIGVTEDALPMDIVWCKVPMLAGFESPPTARGYVGGGHLLLTFPAYDGTLQVAWVITKGSYGELKRRGMPEWIDAMSEHVSSDLAEHLQRFRNDSLEPFLLSTRANHVHTWSIPGLLLLGDAAHTMSPVAAQGLNIALRDAIVAANHLVPAAESDQASRFAEASREIEFERRPEVEAIQALQARPVNLIFRDTFWTRAALRVLPSVLPHLPISVRSTPIVGKFLLGASDVQLAV